VLVRATAPAASRSTSTLLKERLYDQVGRAIQHHNLGMLTAESGNLSEAVERYGAALAIRLRLNDPRTANTIAQLSKTRGLLPGDELDMSARNVLEEDSLTDLHQLLDGYDTAENTEVPGDRDPNS
jgi:hypothetical protein